MEKAAQIEAIAGGLMEMSGAALVIITKTESGFAARVIGPGMASRTSEIEQKRQELTASTGLEFSATAEDLA